MSKTMYLFCHLYSRSFFNPFANNVSFTGFFIFIFIYFTTRMSTCDLITKIRPCQDFYWYFKTDSSFYTQTYRRMQAHKLSSLRSLLRTRLQVRRKPWRSLLNSLDEDLRLYTLPQSLTSMYYCYCPYDCNSEPQLCSRPCPSQLSRASERIHANSWHCSQINRFVWPRPSRIQGGKLQTN